MAYISNDAKKLLKNVANSQVLANQAQPPAGGELPQAQPLPSGQDLSGASPLSPSSAPSLPSKSASSGSFTNLQKYAEKNKPASEKLAGAVSQGIQSAADVAKRNVQQTQSQFGQALEQGSLQGRGTAQEEVKKAALNAAGGVQDPNAGKAQMEQQKALYGQQMSDIDQQLMSQKERLNALQTQQNRYSSFNQAQKDAAALQGYYKSLISPIKPTSSGIGPQDDGYGQARRELAQAFGISDDKVDQVFRTTYNRDPKNFMLNALKMRGFSQDIVNDALNPKAAGSDTRYTQESQPMPKYLDQSAEIADLQKQAKRLAQDKEMYQKLQEFTPETQAPPELLTKASTFAGDVSDERVKEILNAMYKGPQALSEMRRYDETLGKVKEAERKLGKVGRQGVSGDLLQDLFSSPQREYSRGERTLDEAILGQSGKVKDILQTKKDIGSVADVLTKAESEARGASGLRKSEIDAIREGSKGTLLDISKARSGQVEQRMDKVIENWDKLPQYFRDAITKSMAENKGKASISDLESQMLGVASGEGLYNAIKDKGINEVIKAAKADKNKLIGKDEFANLKRLEDLSKLADTYGTVGSTTDFKSGYQDEALAGTQNALESLDTQNLRDIINSRAKQFSDTSNKTVSGTGVGHDRYKSGFKSRDVWERVNVNTNLKDALTKAGFKFDAPASENMANPEVASAMSNYLQGVDQQSGTPITKLDLTDPQSYLAAYGGAFTGDALTGLPIGSAIGEMGTKAVNSVVNALGKINIPGVSNIGSAIGGLLGSGKGNAYSTARRNALNAAKQNLQSNIQKELERQGFFNRFDVNSEDENVRARRADLMKLLAGIDTTNTRPQAQQAEEPVTNQPAQPKANIKDILNLIKSKGK